MNTQSTRIIIGGIVVEPCPTWGYVGWCDVTGQLLAEGTREECVEAARRFAKWPVEIDRNGRPRRGSKP